MEEQAQDARALGNAALSAKILRLREEVAAIDDAALAAKEKAAADKAAAQEAARNAKINTKTLADVQQEMARDRDRSARAKRYDEAEKPEDKAEIARDNLAKLRRELDAADPAKFAGLKQEEFADKLARFKEIAGEVADWEDKLASAETQKDRVRKAATAEVMREIGGGRSINEQLGSLSENQRAGLLSAPATSFINGGGEPLQEKGNQTLELIREGISRLVELQLKNGSEDAAAFAI